MPGILVSSVCFLLYLKENLITCATVGVHVYQGMHVEGREDWRTWFSPTMWSPGWNSGPKLGGKALYLLSNLAGSVLNF